MGKSKPKVPVDDYHLSVHYGVALAVDELVEIEVDDRVLPILANTTENAEATINKEGFFGGDQKRGGIAGTVNILFGGPDQVLPAHLASRLAYLDAPLTPETAPGFRGFLSIWFTGLTSGLSRAAGFKWGSNSPNVPPVGVRVRRRPKGLNPDLAAWQASDGYVHVNGAHMIYEIMREESGVPAASINIATFNAAAQTLSDEGIWLSTRWTREAATGEFIQDILSHIDGVVYIDPATGLFQLKLIRDDYDLETIPTWGTDKVRVENFSRKGRGEIVNRLTLVYTNPETGKDETITSVDEAGIAMQAGELVDSSVPRKMVRNPDVAATLIEKELRVGAAPLASGSLKVLRDANGDGSNIVPGQVFRLEYPRLLKDQTIVCRITDVNYGKTGDRYITVTFMEDIYSLPVVRGRAGSGSMWTDTSTDPAPLDFTAGFTVPFPFVELVSENGVSDNVYPDGFVGLLGWHTNFDTSSFSIAAPSIDALGNETVEVQGIATLTPTTNTTNALVQEASSSLRIARVPGISVKAGDFIVITPASDDATSEWLLVSGTPDFSDPAEVVLPVLRGMFDTTPKNWSAGTRLWIMDENYGAFDQQLRSPGAPIEYQLLSRTSRGTLSLDDAPVFEFDSTERPHMPFRPANVRVDGQGFGQKEYVTDPAEVEVTWANRDRLSEDTTPLAWTDGNVPGEVGQTTEIDIVDPLGAVIHSVTGLTGTSHTLDISDFGAGATYQVVVRAAREGIPSLQAHSVEVYFAERSGYGSSYGVKYGA